MQSRAGGATVALTWSRFHRGARRRLGSYSAGLTQAQWCPGWGQGRCPAGGGSRSGRGEHAGYHLAFPLSPSSLFLPAAPPRPSWTRGWGAHWTKTLRRTGNPSTVVSLPQSCPWTRPGTLAVRGLHSPLETDAAVWFARVQSCTFVSCRSSAWTSSCWVLLTCCVNVPLPESPIPGGPRAFPSAPDPGLRRPARARCLALPLPSLAHAVGTLSKHWQQRARMRGCAGASPRRRVASCRRPASAGFHSARSRDLASALSSASASAAGCSKPTQPSLQTGRELEPGVKGVVEGRTQSRWGIHPPFGEGRRMETQAGREKEELLPPDLLQNGGALPREQEGSQPPPPPGSWVCWRNP